LTKRKEKATGTPRKKRKIKEERIRMNKVVHSMKEESLP